MKLSDRIKAGRAHQNGRDESRHHALLGRNTYNAVKTQVHFRLVEQLDLSSVSDLPRDQLAAAIRLALEEITAAENVPLNASERSDLVADLMNEILGLGPIENLLNDNAVQDILVNGYDRIYVEINGVLKKTEVQFRDNDHLMQIIDRIVSHVGRRIDEASPIVDARLPDGSRVNVIVPPLALNGPTLSIRKFGQQPVNRDDLIANGSLTPEMLAFLKAAVLSKLNILISGGTGAGKTTLLNVLSGFIPAGERIITIEDSAELRLEQPHVVSLEGRPANVEGIGAIRLSDLVKNSLRMRPDRIIVGEARGEEAIDMLQAMNTGHPGSMSTVHANNPRDALSRVEVMVGMGVATFSEQATRALIASAVDIVVQMARLPDGKRRIVSVCEIKDMGKDEIRVREIFAFHQHSIDEQGRVLGVFKGSGTPPDCLEHIRTYGIELPEALFNSECEVV
jgi:pilus assembly protein CpaF